MYESKICLWAIRGVISLITDSGDNASDKITHAMRCCRSEVRRCPISAAAICNSDELGCYATFKIKTMFYLIIMAWLITVTNIISRTSMHLKLWPRTRLLILWNVQLVIFMLITAIKVIDVIALCIMRYYWGRKLCIWEWISWIDIYLPESYERGTYTDDTSQVHTQHVAGSLQLLKCKVIQDPSIRGTGWVGVELQNITCPCMWLHQNKNNVVYVNAWRNSC